MPIPRLHAVRGQVISVCETLRQRVRSAPKQAYVAGGLCLVVALLVGLHTVFSQKTATLRVHVQHSFRAAQLDVLVDDETAYSGKLTGLLHKKFGLFPEGVQGNSVQSIPVTAGSHRISVRVVGDDGSDHAESSTAKFVKGGERELLVVARPADLRATWVRNSDPVSASVASTPLPSQFGWLQRYATALLLTVAGSIVSTLCGYAIREVPGWLKNRTSEPKATLPQAEIPR